MERVIKKAPTEAGAVDTYMFVCTLSKYILACNVSSFKRGVEVSACFKKQNARKLRKCLQRNCYGSVA